MNNISYQNIVSLWIIIVCFEQDIVKLWQSARQFVSVDVILDDLLSFEPSPGLIELSKVLYNQFMFFYSFFSKNSEDKSIIIKIS